MKTHYHYATVTDALRELKAMGYERDFNLEAGSGSKSGFFTDGEFEITEVYRYEGDSDPADEVTVYGIISGSGEKGILVNGYGISANEEVNAVLKKLPVHAWK